MSDIYLVPRDELYHYGVKGMKWGVRKAYKAKQDYKKAKDKAFAKYEKDINNIEKGYKRGQNLSDKDQKRELDAEARYKKSVASAKTKYKDTKKSIRREVVNTKIEQRNKKRAEHEASVKRTTDMFGTGGVVIGGAVKYSHRKAVRSLFAKTMNTAANKYIEKSQASYRTKRGVDFVRKAGIGYLSVKDYADQYNYVRDIYTSASYTKSKYKKH